MRYEPNQEIVNARTGEPLENELRNRGVNKNEQVNVRKAIEDFTNGIEMTEQTKQKFEHLKETQILYDIAYGETAYSLGYSDGVEVGIKKGSDKENTILSTKDMSYLIAAYDAIREMNTTLLGKFELHTKEEGVIGVLEKCIYEIIDNGIATEYKLLREYDSTKVIDILNNNTLTPEKRAKILLG